jgi:tRNA(Ile)-lysidine synthase
MSPDPAVAATRTAVRRLLASSWDDGHSATLVVACSGGADSSALLAATLFEAREHGPTPREVVGVTVDHGLQEGSARRAEEVAARMQAMGATPRVLRAEVRASGRGPEAEAREARYAVLARASADAADAPVLLGHTRDDQAETVLLGLARGSGARSLAGMPARRGVFLRPFLDLTRVQTDAACRALGIQVWHDPHNEDPRFTRARVRHRVLPVLEDELGPGVAGALARTADQLADDAAALDVWEEEAWAKAWVSCAAEDRDAVCVDLDALRDLPDAVRRRVLRRGARAAGSPAGELTRAHVLELDSLVTRWRGQGPLTLPGHVLACREGDRLLLRGPSGARGVAG